MHHGFNDDFRHDSTRTNGRKLIPATILLVEDEPTVCEVTRQALKMGGERVVLEASSSGRGRVRRQQPRHGN